jgi:CIC family chloride channel protein
MSGILLAGLMGLVVPLSPTDQTMLAVVGMSACLGAVVRAPMTGILIVFEMTHEFALVPALMVTALISQAISRKLVHHNFYEAILVQDGHSLDHIIPPRDLRSWHQLPVSAIANFQPVTVPSNGLVPSGIATLLRSFPYHAFPVVEENRPVGLLTRQEAEAALAEQRVPVPEAPVVCPPSYSIRRLQNLLIESPSRVALIQEPGSGKLMGLVTMHDLLRAQVAMAETAE